MKVNLQAARVNAGLTQRKAAKMIGISRECIGSWELGRTYPTVPQIKIIEAVYKIRYDDIIFLPKDDALSIRRRKRDEPEE